MKSRRETALELATELLQDIEESRISAADIIKRASRLARLLDDTDAVAWLSREMAGYGTPLSRDDVRAAERSNRRANMDEETGRWTYWTSTIGELQATADGAESQLRAAADAAISISSANPNQYVVPPVGNRNERSQLRAHRTKQLGLMGKILAAVYAYVVEREIELRFGRAVEGAFSTVRNEVDARVARLVPDGAVKLAAAFENASSDNAEDWANAAATCRRLIKAVADELRPPGPPVGGRPMTDDKYINRLIDWIATQSTAGTTMQEVVKADLEDFGKRIDALDNAGHKGAHSDVSQYDASRFVTGVYLLIGDILRLVPETLTALEGGETADEPEAP